MPRDLTVRVRADVGAYQRAMSAAASSTNQFAQSGLKLQKIGMGISNLGDTLTRRVTLPLGLAGAAAIKLASDFDKSFVQMQTLAGVSSDEVDGLKESVLDLAGETGQAPQELAEALYFLQSSGLDSAQAMDALESSAKASAVGLGATADVANAVSSAMLAYAESGLTAAEATDVLIATAREGKAEPAELAGQMGRLLPIASELGITFGDVGGAIAALSTKGNNAEQATTQLVNVMSKLLKPSQQAAELLEKVGLSSEGVRQLIAERGLLGTLEELRTRLGESGFVKYLEDTQAVQGGLALLGGDLEKTKGIIEAVNESAGATDNAFSTWAESMGAQNAQAFAQFQVALIRIGEVLAPIASDVLNFVAQIAEAFSNLSAPVQTAIIAFAGFAAALGPIMSIGGRLVTVTGTIIRLLESLALPAGTVSGAFNNATTAATGLSTGLAGVGVAAKVAGAALAVGLVATLIAWNNQRFPGITNLPRDLDKIVAATQRMNEAGAGNQAAIRDWTLEVGNLDDALDKILESSPGLAKSFVDAAEAAGIPAEKIAELRERVEEHRQTASEAQAANAEWAASLDETAGAAEGLAESTKTATEAAQEYLDAVRAQFDPQFAMIDALQKSASAQTELRDATAALSEARAGGDTDAIAEAEARYAEAVNGARGSVVDLHAAAVTLKASMAESGMTAAQVTEQFVSLATQQGFTRGEALEMAGAFGIATGAADTLGATDPNVAVTETGNAVVQGRITRTIELANRIPGQKTIQITAHDAASGTIRVVQRNVDALTGKTITITTRLVQYAVPSYQTFGGGQAAGGPVSASKWYIVGEKGPEAFVPNQSGYIVPNHAMGSVGNWGGGGMAGGYVDNRTINITTGADPQQVVAALRRAGDMGLPITIRGRTL